MRGAPTFEPGGESSEFRRQFFAGLLQACCGPVTCARTAPELDHSYDFAARPSWRKRPVQRLKDLAVEGTSRAGFGRRRFRLGSAARSLERMIPALDGLERTHRLLADAYSKRLLLNLMTLRVLGPSHASLPIRPDHFWDECARIDRTMRRRPDDAIGGQTLVGIPLYRYTVPGPSGPIELYGYPMLLLQVFQLEQYAYPRTGAPIRPGGGDVVIDGGAWVGDTALYFADLVAPDGKVLGLEFLPQNLEVLDRNLALNERLSGRVEAVPRVLWDASGATVSYEASGGLTQVTTRDGGGPVVETETLDDLVERMGLERVDFLKLDVEGAELRALRGAEGVLRRFRPKLAVAVYHHPEDLVEIPAYIHGLGLGYELFLDHFAPGAWETILFCRPAE